MNKTTKKVGLALIAGIGIGVLATKIFTHKKKEDSKYVPMIIEKKLEEKLIPIPRDHVKEVSEVTNEKGDKEVMINIAGTDYTLTYRREKPILVPYK